MTENQIAEIKALHIENSDWLLSIVDGEVDTDNPKAITLENASCLIAKVIHNNTKILHIINGGA